MSIQADEVPEDMDGFVLSITECQHGVPQVAFYVYEGGEPLRATLMTPDQCMSLAQDLITAAARCQAARQLKGRLN
jgi:hypothetical protein